MPKTILRIFLFLLALLCLPPAAQAADDWQTGSLQSDGITRQYRLLVPDGVQKGAPLILLLHGGTQSMDKIFRRKAGGTREWVNIARREKAILLVPNGTNADTGSGTGDKQQWNDVRNALPKVDDVAFIRRLLDEVTAKTGADASRIYVTGASNGGMMTYRLLIEAPELFASGAAFIATLPENYPRERHVSKPRKPLMIWLGTEDRLVKYDGGKILNRSETVMMSGPQTIDWWRHHSRVATRPIPATTLPDHDKDGCTIKQTDYSPLNSTGAPLRVYIAEGAGHAMPSRNHEIPDNFIVDRLIGTVCSDVEGAEIAWQFMTQYPGSYR